MTDYSNQNITGLNLTGANLTGANFTNTNATNVNFTNAIITNATFKNTLITGATLTGITFSNLQKGQLLLRAANLSITAINNLTSLTIQELRTIQPAISLRSLNQIQTVSVAVPNNTGQGYNVTVTPSLTQAVCVFVATNQNIIITTGGATIRTIRNNGTLIQDIDNANMTLNYLKLGNIPYRITAANGDGVIAMIPIDLNQYKVNDSGLGDIVSLNLYSVNSKVTLVYNPTINASISTNNINFNLPTSYSLSNYRMKGKIVLITDTQFDYGAIRFNGQGTIGDSAQLNEQTWSKIYEYSNAANNALASLTLDGYLSRDPIFAHMQNSANTQILLSFDIDLMTQTGSQEPIMVCKGSVTFGSKLVGSAPSYRAVCFFERWSNQTSISQISINNWNTAASSIRYASLDLDIIPIPVFTSI